MSSLLSCIRFPSDKFGKIREYIHTKIAVTFAFVFFFELVESTSWVYLRVCMDDGAGDKERGLWTRDPQNCLSVSPLDGTSVAHAGTTSYDYLSNGC